MEDKKSEETGPKKPSRVLQIGKMLTEATVLVTAAVAYCESRSKTSETTSKAAHSEVVRKLEALNTDFKGMERQVGEFWVAVEKRDQQVQVQLQSEMAKSRAEVGIVKALFTGYALSARSTPTVVSREVEKSVKKAQKAADDFELKPTKKPRVLLKAPQKLFRHFQKPKSWSNIKQQQDQVQE